MRNYGLIETIPYLKDYRFGDVMKFVVLEDGDWTDFLPSTEYQTIGFRTSACVSFSLNNCIETQLNQQLQANVNISDRFLAKMSDTMPGVGNYFSNVARSFYKDGFVFEHEYPYDAKTVDEYYQEVPDYHGDYDYPNVSLLRHAKLNRQNIYYSYSWAGYNGVSNDELREALRYSPLQVTVRAWKKADNRGIYRYVDKNTNHAVMLYKIDDQGYRYIFDHFHKDTKVLSPDFYIGSAMSHIVKVKEKPTPTFFSAMYKAKYDKYPTDKEYMLFLENRTL